MRASASGASPAQIRAKIEGALRFEQQQLYLEASREFQNALTLIADAKEVDLAQQVNCLVHLANCYERAGEFEKSRAVFKKTLAEWAEQLRMKKLNPIDIDYAMTNLDFGAGTLDVAEFYVDNIIVTREKVYRKGDSDLENSYMIGANLLRKSGYKQEADLLEQRGREGPPKN